MKLVNFSKKKKERNYKNVVLSCIDCIPEGRAGGKYCWQPCHVFGLFVITAEAPMLYNFINDEIICIFSVSKASYP